MPRTFISYETLTEGRTRLRFRDAAPGAGNPSDSYVEVTPQELRTALTQVDVQALIQAKLNILAASAGVSNKLDSLLNTAFTPAFTATPLLTPDDEPSPVMLTPWSRWSLGVELAAGAVSAPASAVWPAANRAIIAPVRIPYPILLVKAFWMNGATVAGNVDIGIYDEGLAKVVARGSVAQATINVLQEVDITDTELPRGRYYMVLAASLATATFFRTNPTQHFLKAFGMAEMATAFPLPATITLAPVTVAYLPFFGFSIRTLVA